MDKQQLSRKMTAEQFAAFDTQLYLDTRPNDKVALNMFNNYNKSFSELKKQYESKFGPVMAESGAAGDTWTWVNDPWPWEREAN
jgi:spore coat protein JB